MLLDHLGERAGEISEYLCHMENIDRETFEGERRFD